MRKKRIILVITLSLMLSACGKQTDPSTKSVTQVESTSNTEVKEDGSEEIELIDVRNWVVGDIWNDGFCDFSAYEGDGKDSANQTIDIDFAFSRFQEAYKQKPIYDEYMNSLPESYSTLKETWGKLSAEMETLYNYYKDGVTQSGEPADTALFYKYMNAFLEDLDKVGE